ncbi:MAG: oligosaccharide repeat unit polymerase [Gelidibacter sp.]|nr:oligosaccharide repeat unit polymerase [Gelidibacter sp.]
MDNYLIRVIPLIAFLLIFYVSYKRKNKIAISIISVYLVSSLSSLFITQDDLPFHNFSTDSIFYVLLYTLIHSFFLSLTLFLKPFLDIHQLPKGKIYSWMVIVFSIGALFSIIYLTPYAMISLGKSAYEVRTSLSGEYGLPVSYLTTIAVGLPSFYYVYSFMLYVALIKGNKLNAIFAGIGILSFVINVLTVSGRDGIFLASYSLVIGYFCFEPLLRIKLKKQIKKYFFIILTLGLIPIVKITIDRFSESDGLTFTAFKKGIINYLGMQPFIFSDWLKENKLFHGGANNFSLFTNMKLLDYTEPYTWSFGTYLASFYSISGYLSLVYVSLLFYFIFKHFVKNLYNYSTISIFFFYSFFLHFMISGVFYFRLGTPGGNLFMVISLIMILLLKKIDVKKIR